ncbi:hypothetical protein BST61_g3996 [Cercospora zeina]
MQEGESVRVVRDLLREPSKYETWLERYSAGLILRLAYSKPVVTGKESFVRRILAVVHTVERVASPGAYLVDTFPMLMKLPSFLAPLKREGNRLHNEEISLFRDLLKEGVDSGNDNFCTKWHNNCNAYDLSDDHVAYVIGTLFEADAGTTAAAMCSFLLAMTLHNKEYKLLQNDTYQMPDGEKVFLRAGTATHPVQWSIHREEKLYPHPEAFRPERWLESDWPTFREPLDKFPNLQNYSAFGFGRRICPGMHIAERSLCILIARIAWSSSIQPKKDKEGNPIFPPDDNYVTGFNPVLTTASRSTVQPKPFDLDVPARPGRQSIVNDEYMAVWAS